MGNPEQADSLIQTPLRAPQTRWLSRLLWVFAVMAMLTSVEAETLREAVCPVDFFTNVACRLLSSQLNLDATRIQIYPTNQYTPAVHRLLQLSANIYEATSTNRYPPVFRPLFTRYAGGLGTNLFITGFTNVASVSSPDDDQLSVPTEIAALAGANVPVVNLPVNVYGIPWIIGAKKGFPNFNKFDMESAFQLTRKLQVTRPNTNDFNFSDYRFNQMFNLSLSNQFGVECWNSYTNSFDDSVAIYVRDTLAHAVLTNDEGFSADFPVFPIACSIQITNGNVWPGYNPWTDPLGSLLSFQIPLYTNVMVITNSIYRFNNGAPFLTTNFLLPYEQNVTVNGQLDPQPHWWLIISNEVQVFMLDTTIVPNRVIDYVQLNGPNSIRDLTGEIITNYDAPVNTNQSSATELWNTNIQTGVLDAPVGLISQIGVSLDVYSAPNWNTTSIQVQNEIDGFRAFFGLGALFPGNPGEAQVYAEGQMTNAIQSPYTAKATVVQHVSWQANDPLVHYQASDLNWPNAVVYDKYPSRLTNNSPNGTLGVLNQHYMPWGGNPLMPGFDLNPYNLALKDPLVWRSDDWDFPTHECPSGEWLGRVHRGTPWQTVYLKSQNVLQGIEVIGGVTNYVGTNIWMAWTGDTNLSDATAMAPVQDWYVVSLLAHLMNTRRFESRFPLNDPKTNAWLRLLDGLTALTNNLSDGQLESGAIAQFDPMIIRPRSPQARLIADAIESARASQPGGFFHDAGDILEVPELSDQSPFLNSNDGVQQQRGISDEAYELLPGQLLPLLRADSVGSVTSMHNHVIVRFTGYDDHVYAAELSSNLINWTRISTNRPVDGVFEITNSVPANGDRFYRSVLLR